MRLWYSALLYLLLPLILLRLLWRSRRDPAYRQRLRERFGLGAPLPHRSRPCIWVHAVSVGEVAAAEQLVRRLLARYPEYRLLVTTTTPTGAARVAALFGDRVQHRYLPWDLPGSVRRFLARTRPTLLLLVETELWPNLLAAATRSGSPAMLVNGRLSSRSARRYARWPGLSRAMLATLTDIICQTEADSERFLSLGASPEKLVVSGNLKFDREPDGAERAALEDMRRRLGTAGRPVLVAGSTHEGEERAVLEAFRSVRQSCPDCLLVLAPRHPERCAAVAALCRAAGWRTVRLGDSRTLQAGDAVLLVDTLGELALLYGLGAVAFVGGSLVPRGGHSLIEPALWQVLAS